MVLKVIGLIRKLNRCRPILGYTDTATVKLDFDDVSFRTVKHWASRTMKKFKLEGLIILRSSERHYHVVFDRTVSWAESMGAVAWACLQSKNKGLLNWFLLQCIKGSSTLRVSPKGAKPSPRIVFRDGKQDKEVRNFLQHRRRIKNILRKMQIARSCALGKRGTGGD